MRRGWPEFLESIAEIAGEEAATRVASTWSGAIIYIPKGAGIASARRHAAITREFNGRNHQELAERHQISVRQVYRILKVRRR
jgi:Mor family transcriptional regulator